MHDDTTARRLDSLDDDVGPTFRSGASASPLYFALPPRRAQEDLVTPGTSLHRYVLLAAACLATLSVSLLAQQQQPVPKFRTGVEITPVDVTVLDEQRRPIRGLTAENFVVRVDGKIQKIAAFNEIEIPTASTKSAAWTQEAVRDVTTNNLDDPRLFVIIMDDRVAPLRDFATRNTGKAVAHKIIDTMGPRDMAAIIFSVENEDSQDLTNDKAALRSAVEKYQPDGARGFPALETVRLTRRVPPGEVAGSSPRDRLHHGRLRRRGLRTVLDVAIEPRGARRPRPGWPVGRGQRLPCLIRADLPVQR